jgi:hypothetical protein
MDPDAIWRNVRALRAEPPSLATTNAGRRKVFGAALQQAEELHRASAHCGFSSRPLPLFYSLSQGGRAIAAARAQGSNWQSSSHGLATKIDCEEVFATRVAAQGTGAFQVVAAATGSPIIDRALTLEDLLATLPEVSGSLVLDEEHRRAVPLELEYESSLGEYHKLVPPYASIAVYCGPEASLPTDRHLQALEARLRSCRRADGWGIVTTIISSAGRPCIALTWQLEDEDGRRGYKTVDSVATRLGDIYYLRPTLGQDGGEVSILMTWWAVLLALSSLARYEPARWQAALDVDRSGVAATLEEILDVAQERVPELLFDALITETQAAPLGPE